jgi:plastocyanin
MFGGTLNVLVIIAALAGTSAAAATLGVDVTDAQGKPAPNSVVTLVPDSGQTLASHVPERSIIDQRHEMFIPLVVVVRKGGEVVFTNNDTTMHQVYSFSPIKQFQFEIDQGQVSKPVVFDKAGVAAIGCNIHDSMVAFAFVSDAPWAVVTDAKGHAELRDVPDGTYRASAWHPQMPPGRQSQSVTVKIGGGEAALALTIPVSIKPMPAMKPMHMQDY